MGFVSNKIERSEIKAGDHIYTYRGVYTYSHHGIYVGGNKVVHFTVHKHHKTPSTTCSSSFADCGKKQLKSRVVLSCLGCFLKDGALFRYEYSVTKAMFLAKVRGGCCTTAMSDKPDTVIHRAMYLLRNGFGNYNLFNNNCEDFSLYCKTGLKIIDKTQMGSSGQVLSAAVSAQVAFGAIGMTVVIVPALLMPLPITLPVISAIAMTAMQSGGYIRFRLGTDIGVRKDAVKVRVEDLAETMRAEGSM